MAISVSQLGANTTQISFTGTNTFIAAMSAVTEAFTGVNPAIIRGWLVHDATWLNSAGTTTTIYTQVFKAINVDAITYKYFILRWDTTNQMLNTSVAELWNATNHTATNECYTFSNCASIGYNLTYCDLILNLNPRWAVIQSYINAEPSKWAGCFEIGREDITDTADVGIPCFGWISSNLLLLGATAPNAKPLGTADHTLICLPRTKDGNTGISACVGHAADYGVAQVPHWLATTAATMPYYLSNQSNKFVYNNWDVNKKLVLPIKPIEDYSSVVTNRGQIYGLKMTSPIGENLTKIKIKVDTNGNIDNTGTLTEHFLLNNHFTYPTGNDSMANVMLSQDNLTLSYKPIDMVSTGSAQYYIDGSTHLTKVLTVNKIVSQLTVTGTPTLNNIIYDGEFYIYIATSTGLTRLDIRDDSMSNLTVGTGGLYAITLADNKLLYGSQGTPGATQALYCIDLTTLALKTGTFGGFTSGTGTAFTGAASSTQLTCAVTDIDSNAYFVENGTTGSSARVIKISPTGTISSLSIALGLTYTIYQANLVIVDSKTAVIVGTNQNPNTPNTAYIYYRRLDLTTFTAGTQYSTTTSSALLPATRPMSAIYKDGVLTVFPRLQASSAVQVNLIGLTNGTTADSIDVTGSNIGAVTTYGNNANSTTHPGIWYDGCSIWTTYDTGIRRWLNINGKSCGTTTDVRLGQMVIPA